MDKDVEDFLKDNPPKFKLKPYSKAILELLKQGCSQTQILKFLKEKKVLLVLERLCILT